MTAFGISAASMGPPIYIGGNGNSPGVGIGSGNASMGPPIYIGGNHPAGYQILRVQICFNGATDLYRWKPSNVRTTRLAGWCFNGATDLYRWKLNNAPDLAGLLDVLQWGHRFISVETRPSLSEARDNWELQWGHRFISVETREKSLQGQDR